MSLSTSYMIAVVHPTQVVRFLHIILEWSLNLEERDSDRLQVEGQCCNSSWLPKLLSIAQFDISQLDIDTCGFITSDPNGAWAKVTTAALECGQRSNVFDDGYKKRVSNILRDLIKLSKKCSTHVLKYECKDKRPKLEKLEGSLHNFKKMQLLM
jgi:hypothetical protein